MNEPTNEAPGLDEVSPEQRDRLIEVLHSLEDHVRRQNSLKFTFLKGAVYGLGTVVGASILVALFGGLIATTVNSLSGEEVLSEESISESLE